MNDIRYWTCCIGPVDSSELPNGGADNPPRSAASEAVVTMIGRDPELVTSGWGDREPTDDRIARLEAENAELLDRLATTARYTTDLLSSGCAVDHGRAPLTDFAGCVVCLKAENARLRECLEHSIRLARPTYIVPDIASREKTIKRFREALNWIAQQPCARRPDDAEGYTPCSETDDCVTEWCLSCYARAALAQEDKP